MLSFKLLFKKVPEDPEVVPRVCVGMIIVVCLVILMALIVSVVDWELNGEERIL
jgi:hypothetical protein